MASFLFLISKCYLYVGSQRDGEGSLGTSSKSFHLWRNGSDGDLEGEETLVQASFGHCIGFLPWLWRQQGFILAVWGFSGEE